MVVKAILRIRNVPCVRLRACGGARVHAGGSVEVQARRGEAEAISFFLPPAAPRGARPDLPGLAFQDPPAAEALAADAAPREVSFGDIIHSGARLCEFSTTQNGSRQVQLLIERALHQPFSRARLETFVRTRLAVGDFFALAFDPFGNYVAQKLIEALPGGARGALFELAAEDLLRLAFHRYGCRVLQAFLKHFPPARRPAFDALVPHMFKGARDANANHVLQVLVERGGPALLGRVVSELLPQGRMAACAADRFGCLVLQKLIQHAPPAQCERVLAAVLPHALRLANDPFGNYVVQCALREAPDARPRLLAQLRGEEVRLACLKYSSNVVETALETAGAADRARLLDALLCEDALVTLVSNNFGNFVVNCALRFAAAEQLEAARHVLLKYRLQPERRSALRLLLDSHEK